eukprot:gene10410-3201_t
MGAMTSSIQADKPIIDQIFPTTTHCCCALHQRDPNNDHCCNTAAPHLNLTSGISIPSIGPDEPRRDNMCKGCLRQTEAKRNGMKDIIAAQDNQSDVVDEWEAIERGSRNSLWYVGAPDPARRDRLQYVLKHARYVPQDLLE